MMTRRLRPEINPETLARDAMPDGTRILGTKPNVRDRSGTRARLNEVAVLVQYGGQIAAINQPLTHQPGARPQGEIRANAMATGSFFDPATPNTPSDRFGENAEIAPPPT